MARQERVRRENPHRDSANREGVPCSFEELYENVQQEIAEGHDSAHEAFVRLKEMDVLRIGKRVADPGWNASDYCCLASYNGYECSCNQ
jgi:hypothetical protein